tara:strand:+ start:380 stop:592 length:213 start_codon:yes stop_codon:yes gene_type:complete
MKVGDLCWDIVSESLWIVTNIWWCPLTEDYKYDMMNPKDLLIIVANETVATYMRADFLKRTKNVLDKSEE